MRKLWLIFAQAVTISLAALIVVVTLRPDLVPWTVHGSGIVPVREPSEGPHDRVNSGSFSGAARKAMPSVVNIFTSKDVKVPPHPFRAGPRVRRLVGDHSDGETHHSSSLGSGVIIGPEGYIWTNHH